ncbi:MAG: uroporphyrinogen decarboxylase family protein [Candidatus Latescibacteria bacterium]|jgi:hypothetical protein|nr:hypothetical protein [Gemmatimonadaceae bacterium]MDP7450425.1 uroporphyrinogen decarboxylase family protein [Candidatus Latescibacterota bacterium]HJP31553.1 uroporphyrinogen decarboxylase family protein [Candidatus Latescibacterota bacterium]
MTDTIKGTMTGKERMRAALLGEPVDRVPIWLREGFDFHLGLPDADDFSLGWRAEAEYRELWGYAGEYCDLRSSWSPGGHFNRVLGIDPAAFESRTETVSDDIERVHTTVHTPAGNLVGVSERRRGAATSWSIGYPVGTTADLDALRRVPFDVAPVRYEGYERLTDALGDRGVACLSVSCPWVVFSTVTCFEQALIWSITHRDMVHEVLDEITTRILACLEAVFSRPLDTVVNIGGSEQCTPSMMRPEAYAEFVTPYESRIVSFLRNKGVPVNCHCHGRITHALPLMIEAGFDATDPTEAPEYGGDGDLSMARARELVGNRLTLCGNLQFEELERWPEDHIRARVREIIDTGKGRLVLTASAGPTSRMSREMIANYYAWIDEAVTYGTW